MGIISFDHWARSSEGGWWDCSGYKLDLVVFTTLTGAGKTTLEEVSHLPETVSRPIESTSKRELMYTPLDGFLM